MTEYTFIPCTDKTFPYYSARKLFNVYIQEMTENKYGFTRLIKLKKPFIYAILVNDDFKGILYIDEINDNICQIAGFSRRKQSIFVPQGIKYFCHFLFNTFNFDEIQAKTKFRYASIIMLKAGFKKRDNLLYINRSMLDV